MPQVIEKMDKGERYEIQAKIGQGGVGAVYRAIDHHLNREVAIKRVLAGGGYENQDEATKAMLKEATSLCSIQHPHIVTVFDAGVDDDGPYVVMELLSGRTIDEMVERGTLTLEDFREVALQTQEALIAAQDLDLVHRDIKPTNIMVTWLPSGRFQVKLVDFGLAKFSPKPSLQTIDHGDAVFGSIHFMAPEQFERTPLDKRTDMYSIGCVYYYCLAGVYPFGGDTAPLVMTAHLQNTVTPLSEHRPDLPSWLCDWVMWHLARPMDDRPSDARESLSKFLMSENPNTSTPANPEQPKRPKLIIPGAAPAPDPAPAPVVAPETAPQPILPPKGAKPSVHTQPQALKAPIPAPITPAAPPAEPTPITEPVAETPAVPVAVPPAAPAPVVVTPPAPVATQPAPPAPVVPAAVATASLTPASEQQTVHLQGATPPITAPIAGSAPAPNPLGGPVEAAAAGGAVAGAPMGAPKKGMSPAVKATIGAFLAAGLVVAIIVFMGKSSENNRIDRMNELVAPYSDIDPSKPLPTQELSEDDISLVLSEIITPGAKEKGARPAYLTVLWQAESADGNDIDAQIAKFAAEESINTDIRIKLFEVLGKRKSPSAINSLIKFAGKTDKAPEGKSALAAASKMATADNFGDLLAVISIAEDKRVKAQSAAVLSDVVSSAKDSTSYAPAIVGAYKIAVDDDTRASLIRLMGAAGGDEATAIIKESISSEDKTLQLSAIAALRQWPDGSMFETLHDFVDGQEDNTLRRESFEAMVSFLNKTESIEDEDREIFWSDVATVAVGENEQLKVVGAMANQNGLWAEAVLDYFIEDEDADATDRVIDRADRAKRALSSRIRRLNK